MLRRSLALLCAAALLWPSLAARGGRHHQDPARRRRRRLPAAAGHGAERPDRAAKAREAGVTNLKVEWIKLGGPALVNDLLLSGSADVVAAGPPAFLTLWDRTRGNVGVKGVAAMTSIPMYLNTRAPHLNSTPRPRAHRQDRDHGREGLDPGHHHADGGDQGVRRRRVRPLRQVHGRADAPRCAHRPDVGPRRYHGALRLAAVPPARAQGAGRAHDPDLQRRHGRPQHVHHALHDQQVPRRQPQGLCRVPEGAGGGDRLHQRRQARRRAGLPRHGGPGHEARRGAGGPQRSGHPLHDIAGEPHEVRRVHGRRRQHQTPPAWQEMFFPAIHGVPGS